MHMYCGWFQPHQTAGHSCASMRCSTTPTTRAYSSGVGVELVSVLQGDLLTLTCGAATCRCSRAHLPGYGCFFLWRPFARPGVRGHRGSTVFRASSSPRAPRPGPELQFGGVGVQAGLCAACTPPSLPPNRLISSRPGCGGP